MNIKKFRGSRTCGGGTHKNRRGAGNRGGRGKCGACKHHAVRAFLRGYTYGKHGFTRPQKVISGTNTVNIGEIDGRVPELLRTGVAEQKDGVVHIDAVRLGINKILGTGKVNQSMMITAPAFSATAIAKIESAGGTAVIPSE
ncbi:MAG TPA: 50S ribosomal protein L15 [Methanosarcinales archaeon]|nr:50S ribosomal protein L15 [Methanosarcinales archaeon]